MRLNQKLALFGATFALLSLHFSSTVGAQTDKGADKMLIQAAQKNQLNQAKRAIEKGANVNFKTDYGQTALFFACDRGNIELVKLLLEKGADPNVKDTFYNATPLTWAEQRQRSDIALLLFKNGADGLFPRMLNFVVAAQPEKLKDLLALELLDADQQTLLKRIVALLPEQKQKKLSAVLTESMGDLDVAVLEALQDEQRNRLVGTYARDGAMSFVVEDLDGTLSFQLGNEPKSKGTRVGKSDFFYNNRLATFLIKENGPADEIQLTLGSNVLTFKRSSGTETAKGEEPKVDAVSEPMAVESTETFASTGNWPGFRGTGARGIADGIRAPGQWNVADDDSKNENLLWKTPLEGLGMSSPAIWGDRVFVTSAVAEGKKQNVKIGLYGSVDSVEDDRKYEFQVICLDKKTGEVIWKRVANQAKPQVKRHAKSSHANPTVTTNGKKLVAFFGSEGLYCYDVSGTLLWKQDLGFLDSGWFYDPSYQWGFGSSPVIHKDKVIVQCDIQEQSFIAAYSLKNGEEVWRTNRDEIPGWASPTVHEFEDITMVITNGTKSARGYDFETGNELWTLKGHSEIVVPTPFVANNLMFVASGYRPIRPIYAIKPSARGNIDLAEGTSTNDAVQWSLQRDGPYMPSPIVYQGYLYSCANNGILGCYNAKTGEKIYRKRMKAPGSALSFTSSPIAYDDQLFFTAEDGRVLVVKAGPKYELLRVNKLNADVLASPAVSEGVTIFRTTDSVIAVGG